MEGIWVTELKLLIWLILVRSILEKSGFVKFDSNLVDTKVSVSRDFKGNKVFDPATPVNPGTPGTPGTPASPATPTTPDFKLLGIT